MSFTGSLDDVTVVDLLQFIRIGARTGTLTLISGLAHAEIGFHRGSIVGASGPGSLRLGELLLVAGFVDMETLDAALELQKRERPRRTLGRILTDGGLSTEAILQVVRQQIEEVVQHVVSWRQGTFEFAPDELKAFAELALAPGETTVQVDTQSVLLEALQLLDENARYTPCAPEQDPPEPRAAEAKDRPRAKVQLVTRDADFAAALARLLESDEIPLVEAGLHEAGQPLPGEGPPFVLLDLRAGSVPLPSVAALRRTRPRTWLLCILEQGAPTEPAYRAGALTVLPPDPELWASWIRTLADGDTTGGPGQQRRRDLLRMRRIFDDLRAGLLSTSVSLSLMSVVSESVERCVLLLARSHSLVALGAFGAGPVGMSLAQVAAGLRFDVSVRNAFTACLESGAPLLGSLGDAMLPESFFERIGPPRTGKFAVLPVAGGQRVVALLYVDNGASDRALDDMEMLELAASQAGVALENEILRRQASRGHPVATS